MNNQDYEFQETLMSLGENRPTAMILAYMRNRASAKSTEIEHETGLRQPEVSISMMRLQERGWIKTTQGRNPGKGAPYNIYELSINMDEMIQTYQKQVETKASEQMKLIQALKDRR